MKTSDLFTMKVSKYMGVVLSMWSETDPEMKARFNNGEDVPLSAVKLATPPIPYNTARLSLFDDAIILLVRAEDHENIIESVETDPRFSEWGINDVSGDKETTKLTMYSPGEDLLPLEFLLSSKDLLVERVDLGGNVPLNQLVEMNDDYLN